MWLKPRSRSAPAEDSASFAHVAERFRRTGDLTRAVALCQDGLRRFPDHVSARVTLGWALLDLGQFDEAQQHLQHALKRAPDNLLAIRGLAHLHEHTDGGYAHHGDAHDHQSWFDHGHSSAANAEPAGIDEPVEDSLPPHFEPVQPLPAPVSQYKAPDARAEEPTSLAFDHIAPAIDDPAPAVALVDEDRHTPALAPTAVESWDHRADHEERASVPVHVPALDEEPMSEEALLQLEAMMEDAESVNAGMPLPIASDERSSLPSALLEVETNELLNGLAPSGEESSLDASAEPAQIPYAAPADELQLIAPDSLPALDALLEEPEEPRPGRDIEPAYGLEGLDLLDHRIDPPQDPPLQSRAIEAGLERLLNQVRNRRLLLG